MNDDIKKVDVDTGDTPPTEPNNVPENTEPVTEAAPTAVPVTVVEEAEETATEPLDELQTAAEPVEVPQTVTSEPLSGGFESESSPVPETAPLAENTVHDATGAAAASSKMPKKKFLLSALIILVVLAVIGGLWMMFGKGESENTANNQGTLSDVALLRVADVNGPIGNDYLFPNAAASQLSTQIDFQVYEGLVGFDNQRIVPLLATSWTNPDTNTWVFKLKSGVVFHNGKALTAQDVKTSLDALAKDKYWGQFMQTVSSVTVSGDNEVTVKTASPDSLLLNRLAYAFVYQTNADKTTSGTGAYTIDTANSKTEDKTKLVAYQNYHQGKPKTQVVEYTVYPDYDTVAKDMNDGKIDYASFQKNSKAAGLVNQTNYGSTNYSATGAYGITMNMIKVGGPLQKLEVRQALALALDRQAYIADAKSSKIATNYVVPKAVVGYDETAKYPDFNSAKAIELATKAGYPTGVPLQFNYINGLQTDVPALVNVLNKSGFKITAKAYPSPKEFVADTSKGNYDLFVGTFNSDLNDGLDIFSSLLGSKTSQFPTYDNPTFDAMLASAEKAFNAEEHVKKVQEINRYAKDNSLWLPIANSEYVIYYPQSYNFTMDSVPGLIGMYFWKLGNTQAAATTN